MATYILVPGAWHGAWCWSRIVPLLRAAGHTSYAVTLTGVGDRVHLLNKEIRLHTHIQDVLNLIAFEELEDIRLVGHSYAGMVITGVADVLLREQPNLLQELIYIDAVTPHPGESWSSQHTEETITNRINAAKSGGGLSIPPPDASIYGLSGNDRDWVNKHQTPQPFGVYQDTLTFDLNLLSTQVRRTFIDCISPALPTIAVMRERVRQESNWHVIELSTGHDPMVSDPHKLFQALFR